VFDFSEIGYKENAGRGSLMIPAKESGL
jgi:hypothetical protein